jgi:UDP-N-acetylmuramate--alanine ligase
VSLHLPFHPVADLPLRIHFCGIGGAGMNGLARVLHQAGHLVTGSDRDRTPVVEELLAEGIPVRLDQAGLPEATDLVVRTAAMPLHHPELQAATGRGLPILRRAELLGRLCHTPVSVAVAGTHGKTTITAMIAQLMSHCAPDGGWFIGGTHASLPPARLGEGQVRVCEADEFDRSFLELHPTHLVLGAVDWDHADIYPTRSHMEAAFDQLAEQIRGDAPLIRQVGRGALGGEAYVPACVRQGRRREITVGEDRQADLRVVPRAGGINAFDLLGRGDAGLGHLRLQADVGLPGAHNRVNAATALAWILAGEWGRTIEGGAAAAALAGFQGLARRFQLIAVSGSRRLYDDYAHHPSEIAAFLQGLREISKGPVTVIHQPHTFSRVRAFAQATGEALSQADRAILWPVFAAREVPEDGISHRSILPWLKAPRSLAVDSPEELVAELHGRLAPDEIVATVGAGDLYKYHDALRSVLEA